MQFLDRLVCVLSHLSDGSTIDIQKCPNKKRFVVVSSSTLGILNADKAEPAFGVTFEVGNSFQDKGLFMKACWINGTVCAVLTNLGKVCLFNIELDIVRDVNDGFLYCVLL